MSAQSFEIAAPHPDVDFSMPRPALSYAMATPETGCPADEGLILYVGGYGSAYNDQYTMKLLPFLAQTYNCTSVSVGHFDECVNYCSSFAPTPDFFSKLKERHGVSVTVPPGVNIQAVMTRLLEALGQQGITELHTDCQLIKAGSNYLSFGLMPALDVLQVAAEVMRLRKINRRRIFLFGTSYGGYISLLAAKLAPRTFRLVVDNSGFSGPQDNMLNVYGLSSMTIRGIKVRGQAERAFSPQPEDPAWFSPHREAIRNLLESRHYSIPSDTLIHSYHSETDSVAPTARKRTLAILMSGVRRYSLTVISNKALDGRVFKTSDHGMQASMRGMFERSYRRWEQEAGVQAETTDFDLRSENVFDCGTASYAAQFSPDGVHLTIT